MCCVSCVCAAFPLCPGMSLPSIHGAASLWCQRGFISAACPHAFARPPLAPAWPCSHGEGAAKRGHVSCAWERGHSSCCSGWEGPGTAGACRLLESSRRGTGTRWSPPCWRRSCWRLGASSTGMLLPPGDHDSPAGHCSGSIPDQWSDTERWRVDSPVQLCVPSRRCSRALPVPWRDCARSHGGRPAQRWARCFPGNGFKPGVMATATTRITSLPINQGETEPQRYWSFVVLEPEQYHSQSGHTCQHCDRSGTFTSLFHGAAARLGCTIAAQKPH